MGFAHAIFLLTLAPVGIAQERLWQVAGGALDYITADAFVDFNGDGHRDLLAGVGVNPGTINVYGAVRILSGLDGSTLFERIPRGMVRAVGDFDLDGQRDYITLGPGNLYYSVSIEVRSFATGNVLWTVAGPGEYGYAFRNGDTSLMADLDLTGDGRPDLLAMTDHPSYSVVYAYSNSGALLYQIPFHPFGWVANNVTAMPDLDGDGSQDFLVGCVEPSGRGAVVVVSGRTGSLLRISYGVLPGDYIGGTVCNAGDIDQDGIVDYAASSYLTSPLASTLIFSGRTGAVLYNWTDFASSLNGMTGDVDVDLDGIPDLIVGGSQIRAYSGRDGTVLWNLDSTGPNGTLWPWPVFNLGVQPGSPYPVLACLDRNYYSGPTSNPSYGRIITFRANLVGAGPVSGAPCTSIGDIPQIGMRLVPGHSRITISDGPPGALAWLVGAPAAQSVGGGFTVPSPLDSFGLMGCTAYVPPIVMVPTVLGSTGLDRGHAAIDLPWPSLSPSGLPFAAQWLLLDPLTGAYAMSARHEFRVQ